MGIMDVIMLLIYITSPRHAIYIFKLQPIVLTLITFPILMETLIMLIIVLRLIL